MFRIRLKGDPEIIKHSRVKSLINEVKVELLKVVLINTFLDSIMTFFITYFIMSFFDLEFRYIIGIPAVITFLFFTICFIKRTKKLKLKVMEDANPQVKEMLRTANDNLNLENVMNYALFEDLKKNMQTTSAGNLLESKKIVTRIISAIAIVFLIIFISSLNLNIEKINIDLSKIKLPGGGGSIESAEGNITDLVFNETEVIYGDADVAKLGNEKIDLNINPSMSEIDFNQISDAEDNQLREGEVPQEIVANPDAFSNQKLLDEAEQAVNYSQRIKDI